MKGRKKLSEKEARKVVSNEFKKMMFKERFWAPKDQELWRELYRRLYTAAQGTELLDSALRKRTLRRAKKFLKDEGFDITSAEWEVFKKKWKFEHKWKKLERLV